MLDRSGDCGAGREHFGLSRQECGHGVVVVFKALDDRARRQTLQFLVLHRAASDGDGFARQFGIAFRLHVLAAENRIEEGRVGHAVVDHFFALGGFPQRRNGEIGLMRLQIGDPVRRGDRNQLQPGAQLLGDIGGHVDIQAARRHVGADKTVRRVVGRHRHANHFARHDRAQYILGHGRNGHGGRQNTQQTQYQKTAFHLDILSRRLIVFNCV